MILYKNAWKIMSAWFYAMLEQLHQRLPLEVTICSPKASRASDSNTFLIISDLS